MAKRLLIIDPLAEDDGHLLEDDLFWVEVLHEHLDKLLIVTSDTSCKNIQESGFGEYVRSYKWDGATALKKTNSHHLKYIARLSLKASNYDAVLFQSFHEVSALWFMLLNPSVPVFLIVTNNLTGQGTRSSKKAFLQKLLFRKAAGIFVGSRFEVDRIKEISPSISISKVHLIRYHKIGVRRNIKTLSERNKEIVFLGTPTIDRGIETFLDWAERGLENFKFAIHGRLPKDSSLISRIYRAKHNIRIFDKYLDDDEYHEAIANASFVALPFLRNFEGRLSGVLADSISHGTPVIATKQEPHTHMFEKYGPFGYLIASNERELRLPSCERLTHDWCDFQESMQRARLDNSKDAIRRQILDTLNESCDKLIT